MDKSQIEQSDEKGASVDSDAISAPQTVYKPYATIRVSQEFLDFTSQWREAHARLQAECIEQIGDLIHGPRYGPTRGTLQRMRRKRSFAERGQRLLAELRGSPAGPLRRS